MQDIKILIEEATLIAGSLRKLAVMLDMQAPTLVQMKKGERPANWRVRGGLRAILGEEPAAAFMAAMAEDLEQSEKEDEKKAAEGFRALLAAFDRQEKSPLKGALSAGGNERFRQRGRTITQVLELATKRVIRRLRDSINSTLHCRQRNAILAA